MKKSRKITKRIINYPKGFEPDYINPPKYTSYRYAIGKRGANPLVVICMNPLAADEKSSDLTVNRVIKASQILNMDGWIVFNTYPERATNKKDIIAYGPKLVENNIEIICDFLKCKNIKEVWVAWGDEGNNQALVRSKKEMVIRLKEDGVKMFYFGTLTKKGNPRHPSPRGRALTISLENKKYLCNLSIKDLTLRK